MRRFHQQLRIFMAGIALGALLSPAIPSWAHASEPVLLKSAVVDLMPGLSILEDPTGKLTLEDVHQLGESFKPVSSSSFGYTKSVFWIRVRIENHFAAGNWVLQNEYPLVSYQQLHLLGAQGNEVQPVQQSGRVIPFKERYRPHRTPNFKVGLPQGSVGTIYIKAWTVGSLQFPLKLYSERAFSDYMSRDQLSLGLYYGVLISIIFFNLMLYAMVRSLGYLLFATSVLSFFLVHTSTTGVMFQLLLSDHPEWIPITLISLLFSTVSSHALFARYFLQLKTRSRRLSFVVSSFLVLALISFLSYPFVSYAALTRVGILLSVLVGFMSLVAGIQTWRNGFESARLFVLGWCIFFLGIATYALTSFGVLPSIPITENGLQWGSIGEALFITMALGERWAKIRSESAAAKKKIAEIQARLNRGLESKVMILERTAAGLKIPFQNMKAAVDELTRSHRQTEKLLESLMGPIDAADSDMLKVQSYVQQILDKVSRSLSDIEGGTLRMGGVVAQISAMNRDKTDHKDRVALSLPWDIATSRLREGVFGPLMSRVIWSMDREKVDGFTLQGNPHLYGIAIEAVMASVLKRVPIEAPLVSLEFSLLSDFEIRISSGGLSQIAPLPSNDPVFNLVAQVLGAYGGGLKETSPGVMILKLVDHSASEGVFDVGASHSEVRV